MPDGSIQSLPAAAASPQPCEAIAVSREFTGEIITVPADYKPLEADWLLLDLIKQSLYPSKDKDGYYDTGSIRIHKQAMQYLCSIGLMEPHPVYVNDESPFRDFVARERQR